MRWIGEYFTWLAFFVGIFCLVGYLSWVAGGRPDYTGNHAPKLEDYIPLKPAAI